MTYIGVTDVEEFTGFTYTDFKKDGRAMTEPEWNTFCSTHIDIVTQLMHRYCGVESFEATTVVELHDGSGATGDESATSEYLDSDRSFSLRKLPVISVTSVEEDTAGITAVPNWVTRTERSDSDAGDYVVQTDYEFTKIVFHSHIPSNGRRNVRITYQSGYLSSSEEFSELTLILKRMMQSVLLTKKKVQEATTIRNANVRDYSQMFEPVPEQDILTESIILQLERYRRLTVPTSRCYV